MKRLWTYIDGKNWRMETKYRAALLIVGAVFVLSGLAVRSIIRIWALSTWEWMACFVGYPFVISRVVVYLYMCRHDFHDGKVR